MTIDAVLDHDLIALRFGNVCVPGIHSLSNRVGVGPVVIHVLPRPLFLKRGIIGGLIEILQLLHLCISGSHALRISSEDRKSVVSGKSVSVRVDIGGRRIIKKKKNSNNYRGNLKTTYNICKTLH